MSKLVVLLALYAAGVATWLLLNPPASTPAASHADARQLEEDRSEHVRRVMTEARSMMRAEIKDILKNIDWRLGRIDALRKSLDEGVSATQRAAEDAASSGYSKIEEIAQQVNKLTALTGRLKGVQTKLVEFEKRVAAVEARPAQIIREVGGGPGTGPERPKEPDQPALPPPETKDPEIVRAETAKARQDLQSDDLDVLFPAIEKIREYRVLDAVPRLLELLAQYPDPLGRMQAAAALGEMEVCDAIPALAEALVDKSDLVAQQANKSIRKITTFDTEIPMSARIRTRRAARNKFKEWWRANEEEVRRRLGQPKSPAAPK